MGTIDYRKFRESKGKDHKYGAAKTKDLDGVECPSWLHAEVANELIQRRNLGVTKGFDREVSVRLTEKCKECGAGAMVYKVDFVEYFHTHDVFIEAKGAEMPSFRRRKRQWKKTGPGTLEIWKGRYRNGKCIPYLAETVMVEK